MFASSSKKNESKKMVPMPIEKHTKGEIFPLVLRFSTLQILDRLHLVGQ